VSRDTKSQISSYLVVTWSNMKMCCFV
jgi:hypothetical protein